MQTLILLGDFNQPDQTSHLTVRCKQSRRLLETISNDFLVQVSDRSARGEALLDLMLTSVEEVVKDIKIRGSTSCSGHALVEFMI